ncbi:MAG TPA: hypothetical protein VGJ92_05845 [Methanocella sp.]|jgi:hypothetical protein
MKLIPLVFFVIILLAISVLVAGCSNTAETNPGNTSVTSPNSTSATNASKTPGAAIVWQHRYGGQSWDEAQSVIQTNDGGYALAGMMTIIPAGQSYEYYSPLAQPRMMLLRTDAGGNELWNMTYGGRSSSGSSVIETKDGGFALLGDSGSSSILLVRTDAHGNELWNRTYEWEDYTSGNSVLQADDGSFIFTGGTGRTLSEYKVIMVKTDALGNILWNRTYEQSGSGRQMVKAADGGYAIAGNTFILKTDANGNELWSKNYKSLLKDALPRASQDIIVLFKAIMPSEDGGFAVAGIYGTISVNTSDGGQNNNSIRTISSTFDLDYLLMKTDASGNIISARTYGQEKYQEASTAIPAGDGGYVIAGLTGNGTASVSTSGISADTNYSLYLVKVDANGNEAWAGTYKVDDNNQCTALVRARDGGYVITGKSLSNEFRGLDFDIFLMKVA